MFDTANQSRLSTADRVDKGDYYRTLLESERHGREQADKEIISLLHDVKNRYETKLNNYMAKKQNQKTKDKADKQPKKASPEKQPKKAQAGDKPTDDWGTSTQPTDKPNDDWGSSEQQADQANDGWGSSAQPEDKPNDDWGNSTQPADDANDAWGSSAQPAEQTNDDWGTSTQQADQANDGWGSSAQPTEKVEDDWNNSAQPADKVRCETNSNKKQNQKSKDKADKQPKKASPEKQPKKAQAADKPTDDWGTSTQPTDKPNDDWGSSAQPAEQDQGQKNQASTDNHEKKEDWIQQINYLQTQLDVSREEAAKLKKRNLRLEKDLDHSKSLIRTLREGCSIVEDQARSFETRHDRIMTTKADLERELIAIKEESSRHITTINKLQKSNEQLSKAFIQSVQSHEACKKELDVLQQKYNRKLESYQIENLRLTEANSQLRKLVEYMQK